MNLFNPFLLVFAIPVMISPLIYLIGRISARMFGNARIAFWLSLITLSGTGIPLYFLVQDFLTEGVQTLTLKSIELQFDGISSLMAIVTLFLGIVVTIFSAKYMGKDEGEEKFYSLLTMMIGMIIGLSCAADLFNLWVWFEGMAISSFLLVAFYRNQPGSLEAGIKYLVQSALGSVFVLIGIGFIFMHTGTLNLAEIRLSIVATDPLILVSGVLFLIGFGVKSALVPMHTWLPDAHSQAPSGISAMLSGIVIEAGLIALLRSLSIVNLTSEHWGLLLMGLAVVNMLVGNLMALRQKQIKRMFAYSSISHMGYILFGVGITVAYGLTNGAEGSFFHILTHVFMKGLAFLAAGAFLYVLHIAKGDHSPLVLDDINGAAKRYPLAAFALSVAVLSLGGLPPLAGFMSKWQIVVAGFETQNITAIVLTIIMGVNSVLSLGYYAPLVNRMYRLKSSEIVENGEKVSTGMGLSMLVLSTGIIVLGFVPTLISWLTQPAAASFLAMFGG